MLRTLVLFLLFTSPAQAGVNLWIQKMRNWEAEQNRLPVEELINNSLAEVEIDYWSDDTPKPEILLQFPSDEDRQSFGW